MIACYIFDPETREFQSESLAQESPLEPGVIPLPPHATLIKPPDRTKGKASIWNGENWMLSPDPRGVYWDKNTQEKHEIKDLTAQQNADWVQTEPTDRESVWEEKSNSWVLPFSVLQKRKISEIRRKADSFANELKQNYSTSEIQSWARQESGARDLSIDPESQTPDAQFVRQFAEIRGIELSLLVGKILENVRAALNASAQLLGTQQKLEDQATQATTEEQLNAISWPAEHGN